VGAQIRVGGAAKVIQTLRLERGELNRFDPSDDPPLHATASMSDSS
jgi:hypothetical protein